MNGLPYYKAYPRDFVEGTIGMPFEIKCAYRVVLDLIYMQGGRLPDDDRYISGHLGCSIRKWKSIRSALIGTGKLIVSDGFLSNNRADKELETLAKLQEKQSENASRPRKINKIEKPRQRHTEPEPEPYKEVSTSSNANDENRDSEFDAVWDSYPRKVGRAAAQKAWVKARKLSDFQEISSGLRRYVRSRDGQDHQFTAHFATWLNQRRWEDEQPDPAGVKTQAGRRGVEAGAFGFIPEHN